MKEKEFKAGIDWEDYGMVDWKASPYQTLLVVDKMLKEFNLEIEMRDNCSDSFAFRVVKG